MSSRTEADRKYSLSIRGKSRTKRYSKGEAGIATRVRHQLTDVYLTKHLRNSYGMTLLEYKEMTEKQGNLCAICGKENIHGARLCVDHNHKSGNVRGLLCTRCNAILGYVDDNPSILRKAAQYLSQWGENG